MKAKNQRLTLLALAAVAVLGAVLLAMSALRGQASFFYLPSDVAERGVPFDRAVRIGGMVKDGSIERKADGLTIAFVVADESPATIPVRFKGITPDLFKENSGVVADGRFDPDGTFVATNILAKHDENYMPAEIAGRYGSKAQPQ